MGIHFAVNSHQTFINILWIQYLFRGLIEPSCPAASPGCFLAFHHLKTHHPSTPQALKRVLLACAFFQRGKPRFRTFGQKKKDGPKSSRKAGDPRDKEGSHHQQTRRETPLVVLRMSVLNSTKGLCLSSWHSHSRTIKYKL